MTGVVETSATAEGSDAAPTVSKPTGLANDDLLIIGACVCHSDTSDITYTWPSGFTLIDQGYVGSVYTSSEFSTAYAHKVITDASGEGASYAISVSTGGRWVAFAIRISGVDTTSPIDANDISVGDSATGDIGPSISPSGSDDLLLWIDSAQEDSSITQPSGMTEIFDHAYSGGGPATGKCTVGAAYEVLSSSGATGTRTGSNGNDQEWITGMVALLSAGGGGITEYGYWGTKAAIA